MAMDMFIKIDSIKGESVDKTHKGEIDVLAWSWGVSNSGSAHVGGGAGAGKANVQDLSFTKYIDKSTPPDAVVVQRQALGQRGTGRSQGGRNPARVPQDHDDRSAGHERLARRLGR